MVSSLPNSLLTALPEGTSQILRVYSYLSWASLQALPLRCIADVLGSKIDYLSSMEVATVIPIATLLGAFIVYLLHVELLHLIKTSRQFRSLQRAVAMRYGTVICMFAYVVAGGVTSLVLGAFQCVDADPDNQVPGDQIMLR